MDLRALPFSDPHSPLVNGVRGRCPRCGEGRLFAGLLKLAPRCGACGLDYSFADPADGPAFFVMSIMGFVSVAILFPMLALPLPDWAILGLVAAISMAASIALLAPFKGWLVCSQYFYKAGEGVLAHPVSSEPCACSACRARQAGRERR